MKILDRTRKKTGGGFFKKFLSLTTAVVFMFTSAGFALSDDSPSIAKYTAYPPFGGRIIKPNVLINLDTSTSLSYFAYDFSFNAKTASSKMMSPAVPPPSTGFNENVTYYGYFDSGKYYTYDAAAGGRRLTYHRSVSASPVQVTPYARCGARLHNM